MVVVIMEAVVVETCRYNKRALKERREREGERYTKCDS